MQPQSITLQVSQRAALGFEKAPEQERQFAVELLERLFARSRPASLKELRRLAEQAHGEATSQGLTEAKLRDLLNGG